MDTHKTFLLHVESNHVWSSIGFVIGEKKKNHGNIFRLSEMMGILGVFYPFASAA